VDKVFGSSELNSVTSGSSELSISSEFPSPVEGEVDGIILIKLKASRNMLKKKKKRGGLKRSQSSSSKLEEEVEGELSMRLDCKDVNGDDFSSTFPIHLPEIEEEEEKERDGQGAWSSLFIRKAIVLSRFCELQVIT